MSKHLLYIIGEPGIGKSSVAAALIGEQPYEDWHDPFHFRRYDSGPVVLGSDRAGGYPGTDSLPRDVQPKVIAWMEAIRPELVFGEGERLGNLKFMLAMKDLGYDIWLYHLVGPGLAAARREARGSHQDASWIKGRRTACNKVAAMIDAWEIYAGMAPDILARMLAGPVAEALRNGNEGVVLHRGTGEGDTALS